MERRHVIFIKKFVQNVIDKHKSEYLILTNFSITGKYITIFKTNFNINKTINNIIKNLKDINNIIDITNDKNPLGVGVCIKTKNDNYYLFDYTNGVIE